MFKERLILLIFTLGELFFYKQFINLGRMGMIVLGGIKIVMGIICIMWLLIVLIVRVNVHAVILLVMGMSWLLITITYSYVHITRRYIKNNFRRSFRINFLNIFTLTQNIIINRLKIFIPSFYTNRITCILLLKIYLL